MLSRTSQREIRRSRNWARFCTLCQISQSGPASFFIVFISSFIVLDCRLCGAVSHKPTRASKLSTKQTRSTLVSKQCSCHDHPAPRNLAGFTVKPFYYQFAELIIFCKKKPAPRSSQTARLSGCFRCWRQPTLRHTPAPSSI